jgi:hypothetical protein
MIVSPAMWMWLGSIHCAEGRDAFWLLAARVGTPAGTYTVTVAGAAGSTQHTTTVTLTVQ